MTATPQPGTNPRPLGSNWTPVARECDECKQAWHGLVLWTDRKMRCVMCGQALRKEQEVDRA